MIELKANPWAYGEDKDFDWQVENYEICVSKEEAIRLGAQMNLESFWVAELIPAELTPEWPDISELVESATEDAGEEWFSGLVGLNLKELQTKIQPLLEQASKIISDAIIEYNGPLYFFGPSELVQCEAKE